MNFPLGNTIFTLENESVVRGIRALPAELYFLESGGRVYQSLDDIDGPDKLIQLHFRCLGGKGGFGSLLRSFRIHKSSNQLMCRNLSGRRLADVKEEERLKKWIAKKAERDKEKAAKKQEKIERLKAGGPKHEFNDQTYLQKRDHLQDEVEDAIEAGMRALQEKQQESPEDGGSSNAAAAEDGAAKESEGKDGAADEGSSSDSDLDLDELLGPGPSKRAKKA